MSEPTQELKLNPAKLKRLITHLENGGERSTVEAGKVLKMKNPKYIAAYIAKALSEVGEPPAPTPEPTPTPEPETPKEAPAQSAAAATPTPLADVPKAVTGNPVTPPAYRLIGDDGQSQKLNVLKVTPKAVMLQLAPVTDMQQIFVGGELVEVDVIAAKVAMTDRVSYMVGTKALHAPDVLKAVELARA
jgi:hypothetical protein